MLLQRETWCVTGRQDADLGQGGKPPDDYSNAEKPSARRGPETWSATPTRGTLQRS